MFCIKCKVEIPDNSIFCNICGKKQVSTARKKQRRAHGSGSIKKLSGNRSKPYAAFYSINGEQKFLGSFVSEKEASLFLQNFNAERYSDKSKWSVNQFYQLWLSSEHYSKLSKSAHQSYAAAWNRLRSIENLKMATIKTSDIQYIIDTAVKTKRYKTRTEEEIKAMKPSDREKYLAAVAKPDEPLGYDGKKDIKELAGFLCVLAMKDDVINKNYAELVTIASDTNKTEKRILTEDEVRKIFDNDDLLSAKITLIYLYTGFRARELLSLKKSNTDLNKRTLISGSKTEAGQNRVVPIHKDIYKYIEYFYNLAPNCPFLITNKGKAINYEYYTRKMLFPLFDQLSIPYEDEDGNKTLTLHSTRHYFTNNAIESHVKPEALQKIVGHKKYETTVNKYGKNLSTDFLAEEMDKI